jgi:hypothetical protein
VIEERGKYRPVSPALQGVGCGGVQQQACLLIAEGRRETTTKAFVVVGFGALHTPDRIVHDRITLAEVLKQRGDPGELAPDRRTGNCPALQVFAPGDEVRAGDHTEFLETLDTSETHEVLQVILVRAARLPIGDVGKPLNLGRHVGQIEEFWGR